MRPITRYVARMTGCAALMLTVAPAQAASAQSLVESAASLGAGQFAWASSAVRPGPVTIVVSLPLQQLFVYRGAALLAVSAVSTGSPGHETPTGAFTILQKDVDHRSNKYSDAPMPYMQRLTWDGVAIHGGRDPGYPASHGCIRVPLAFARRLYAITSTGAHVVVTDDATAPGLSPDYAVDLASARAVAKAAAIDPETAATRAANLAPARSTSAGAAPDSPVGVATDPVTAPAAVVAPLAPDPVTVAPNQ
ncbi:MAG: L,D-transpeptidase family protein [Janthinobacterium lividum]